MQKIYLVCFLRFLGFGQDLSLDLSGGLQTWKLPQSDEPSKTCVSKIPKVPCRTSLRVLGKDARFSSVHSTNSMKEKIEWFGLKNPTTKVFYIRYYRV